MTPARAGGAGERLLQMRVVGDGCALVVGQVHGDQPQGLGTHLGLHPGEQATDLAGHDLGLGELGPYCQARETSSRSTRPFFEEAGRARS